MRWARCIVTVVTVLAALLSAEAAWGTPAATPGVGCAFPPIAIELLREIRDDVAENPPPTPTVEADGSSSSRMHSMPFPPPAGEPLDDETVASVEHFLAEYEVCVVIGEIATTYGAWTEGFIRRTVGPNLEFADALIATFGTERAFWPHPGLDLLLLRAWLIESGHVVAVVQLVGDVPGMWTWTMLLLPADDSWRIDDLWSRPLPAVDENLTGPVYATPIAAD